MHGYLALTRVPGAVPAFVAGLIARLPIGMMMLSVLLLVEQRTGSPAAAGAVNATMAAGAAVGTPTCGRLVDRIGAVPLLTAGAGVQGLALVALTGLLSRGRVGPDSLAVAATALTFAALAPAALLHARDPALRDRKPRPDAVVEPSDPRRG